MIKVELLIDEIDYNDVAELAIPIVKEKLFSKVAGIELDKFLPESMMNYATQKFLEQLSAAQKDELAIKLVHKYRDAIVNALQNAASDKGVHLTIRDVFAQTI